MQDELYVAGILPPGVEGRHGTLMRNEMAFGVPPFFDQRVAPCPTYKRK